MKFFLKITVTEEKLWDINQKLLDNISDLFIKILFYSTSVIFVKKTF